MIILIVKIRIDYWNKNTRIIETNKYLNGIGNEIEKILTSHFTSFSPLSDTVKFSKGKKKKKKVNPDMKYIRIYIWVINIILV